MIGLKKLIKIKTMRTFEKRKTPNTLIVILLLAFILLLFNSCEKEEIIQYNNIENLESWNQEELNLLEYVNDYRLDNNLNQLTPSKFNYDLAIIRTQDNVILNDISHVGYSKVIIARKEIGLEASKELLGYRYTDSKSMFEAFKRSETHNNSLLEQPWKYIGISIMKDLNTNSIYYTIILTY